MSLEDRMVGMRGDYRDLCSVRDFPPAEIYETDRDFGVAQEVLDEQVMGWTSDLSDLILNSGSYSVAQNALVELDELYLVSGSEKLKETLYWFEDQSIFEQLDVETRFLDPDYFRMSEPSQEFTYEPPKDYEGAAMITLAALAPLTMAYWVISSLLSK